MNEAARFLFSLGAAVGVHAAVLPVIPGGAGGGAGEGGVNSASVVAADGAVEDLVAQWQAAPNVGSAPEDAPEPADATDLPAPPTGSALRGVALPQIELVSAPAPLAPTRPAPPPERVFAALPEIPTPSVAALEPAAMTALPAAPPSALAVPLALPSGPPVQGGESAPLPVPTAVPERRFEALPPVPVPEVVDGLPAVAADLPDPAVPTVPTMPALPRGQDMPAPTPEALPRIGSAPDRVVDPAHPPLDRVPVPPRRPEQLAVRSQPEPRTEPTAQARPAPQPQAQAAPAMAARGQGGGAQAGNGGGVADADAGTRRSAMARWGAQIRAQIERRAQRQRGRGSVTLGLRIDASGALVSVSLRQGSGNATLDQAAVAAARSAGPFPRAPDALGRGAHDFSMTLTFRR